MKHDAPLIEKRSFEELLREARSMAPFYIPEWDAMNERDRGVAVLKIYLRMFEHVAERLNQVPRKSLVAFLDMAGIDLQPAQSATAFVTFDVAEGTPENVSVPEGTELSGTGTNAQGEDEEVLFQTEHDLVVSPAVRRDVVSVDAERDALFRHSAALDEGESFVPFHGDDLQEHSLYIAHEDLLNQTAPAKIILDFVITSPAVEDAHGLQFRWEYWDAERERWVALAALADDGSDDSTRRFQRSGSMTLEKNFTAEITASEVFGIENRWIRCRLLEPLPAAVPRRLPAIDTIRLSVNPISSFSPDLAFYNDIPIELDTVRIAMKGKAITLAGLDSCDPVDLETACEAGDVHREEVLLTITGDELQEGDLLEFDNRIDSPQRFTVREDISEGTQCVPLDKSVDLCLFRSAPDLTVVTAIRPGEVDPVVQVDAEVLKGLQLSENSKVLVGALAQEPVYLSEVGDAHLSLLGSVSDHYLSGETLRVVPAIMPFGEIPLVFDTFYIASDEAFSKRGAVITLHIEAEWNGCDEETPEDCASNGRNIDPKLSWEYWNGTAWRGIRVNDATDRFFRNGAITFTGPQDIERVEVNGEEKMWIRVRMVDGDYGREIELQPEDSTDATSRLEAIRGAVHYPIIRQLTISYEGTGQVPQHCLAVNNLEVEDCSNLCISEGAVFEPFVALPEAFPGLYLGFDRPLTGGPLRMFFDLVELILPADLRMEMLWHFWNGTSWEQITVSDGTRHLTQIGSLEWVGSRDFSDRELFGASRYWIKGVLTTGTFPDPPEIKGIFLNTVEALQSAVVRDETAGSSDGTMHQSFALLNHPIIDQTVWVREPSVPSEQGLLQISEEEGDDAIVIVPTGGDGEDEIWVRWHAVTDFDDSGPISRHYTVDRRLGIVRFGDGVEGIVPPVGSDNITATYRFGGGVIGNVPPHTISGLKNAIPFIDAVTNPVAADGGAETETLDVVLQRGPQRLKNRGRAVTVEDFEWMTRSISRKVARAKAIANRDSVGTTTPGWVTVLIVPDSQDTPPLPTNQLLTVVERGLHETMANTVSTPLQLHIGAPDFLEVVVSVTVVPVSLDKASEAEAAVREVLNKFIHPLTGGSEKSGWDFGGSICRSEIIAAVEGAAGVDHVNRLEIITNGTRHAGDAALNSDQLPYSGNHLVNLELSGSINTEKQSRDRSECADAF